MYFLSHFLGGQEEFVLSYEPVTQQEGLYAFAQEADSQVVTKPERQGLGHGSGLSCQPFLGWNIHRGSRAHWPGAAKQDCGLHGLWLSSRGTQGMPEHENGAGGWTRWPCSPFLPPPVL